MTQKLNDFEKKLNDFWTKLNEKKLSKKGDMYYTEFG